MADYRAVAAVSEAVTELLRGHYRPEDFDNELEFRVYGARDFAQPMAAGVSVFLYRIFPNGLKRIQPIRPLPADSQQRSQLPLDLHFLLTAWAGDASLQHTIAGWMMRTVEDLPTLPTGLLNHRHPGLFRADESVTLLPAELSTEELFRIWEVIVNHAYQVSVPYVARGVKIDSPLPLSATGEPVRERVLEMGTKEAAP